MLFNNFLDIWQNWILVEHQWKNFLCWLDLFPQTFSPWYTKSFVELFINKLVKINLGLSRLCYSLLCDQSQKRPPRASFRSIRDKNTINCNLITGIFPPFRLSPCHYVSNFSSAPYGTFSSSDWSLCVFWS